MYNYGYNAYQSPYSVYPYQQAQYQPAQYQQQNQYSQQQYQQPVQQQIQQTSSEPQFVMCDSLDFVKSQNVRMDGGSTYYGLTNGTALFCKKLNPMTGSSVIQEYRLVEDSQNQDTKAVNNDQIYSAISQLQNEMTELKNIVMENLTAPHSNQKGGGQR